MAQVRFNIEFNSKELEVFNRLRKMFPELRARTLGYVGKAGKSRLKTRLLSGQEIDLEAYPTDKKGRPTVQSQVGRGAGKVTITSYPANLFEHGRLLRSGAREPGKKIITGKLKSLMKSDIQNIVNDFDNNHFQKLIDKM